MESHTSNIKVKFQIFMSVSDSRIHGGKAVYHVLAFKIIWVSYLYVCCKMMGFWVYFTPKTIHYFIPLFLKRMHFLILKYLEINPCLSPVFVSRIKMHLSISISFGYIGWQANSLWASSEYLFLLFSVNYDHSSGTLVWVPHILSGKKFQ